MPLLYALVARRTAVLAEFSAVAGNAARVARAILEALPSTDSRVSYSQDRHLFHVLCSGGLVYLAMADEAFGRRVPFAFLEEVRGRFTSAYGAASATALAHAYNAEFSRVLSQQLDFFNSPAGADLLARAASEVGELRAAVVQNIDAVLERGERLELLVDKTEGLKGDAFKFKKASTGLRTALWAQNLRLGLALAGLGAGLLYFLLGLLCGFALEYCRHAR